MPLHLGCQPLDCTGSPFESAVEKDCRGFCPLSVPCSGLIMAPSESGSFRHVNVDVFFPILLVNFLVVACIVLLHITIFNHARHRLESLNTTHDV